MLSVSRHEAGPGLSVTTRRAFHLLLIAAGLLGASLAAAQQAGRVEHSLSFPRKNSQYVHVRSEFPAGSETLEVALPSWTPGSYLIRDYAGSLEGLSAKGPEGQGLPTLKVAKNRWRIDTSGVSPVILEYDVWAGRKNVAESWIESDFALLNGAGLFLYSEESRTLAQTVRLELPPAWTTEFTSLDALSGGGGYVARDYDELVDSPIVLGNGRAYDFNVDGRDYALVLATENSLWDGEAAAEDVAQIVRAQQAFWGVDPFEKKYLFLNLFMDQFGGLEHDHSTVMMCSPWQMRGREDYVKWLGLVSHEFFHSWNVRRMRPEALGDYDYDQEVYTRELWLAEGLSSYYDNLLLFRSGLIQVAEYFNLLADEILNYETTPGREVRSAELASLDTWIKHYKPDRNKLNSTISYYRKGALIGFVTDTAIRRQTNNRSSLDTVMRKMYSRYGGGDSGHGVYPPGAFEDIVEEEAGAEVRRRVERLLRSTDDPRIEDALGWYGLTLNRSQPPVNGDPTPGGLGVRWEVSGGSVLAEHVLSGYPASDAGVLPGDELLAIQGIRLKPENYLGALQKIRPGEEIELVLARYGRLVTLSLVAEDPIPAAYAIHAKPRMSRVEKKRLEAWLGRPLAFNGR